MRKIKFTSAVLQETLVLSTFLCYCTTGKEMNKTLMPSPQWGQWLKRMRMNQLLVVNVNMTEVFEDWLILLQNLSLLTLVIKFFPTSFFNFNIFLATLRLFFSLLSRYTVYVYFLNYPFAPTVKNSQYDWANSRLQNSRFFPQNQ